MAEKKDARLERAQQTQMKTQQAYGLQSASTGRGSRKAIETISTGSLLWDYMSGIGGHGLGIFEESFGAPSIGKTTVVAGGALRSAHAQGMVTGIIAVEPDVDEDWMEQQGVNPDYNVVARPDNGDEAFGMLHDWIYDKAVDYIVFDSIGAVSSAKEQDSDKAQAFGNSALISWGVKRVAARAWKNGIGVLFINQQRDDTRSKIAGLVESGGGWAFKHAMKIRTHIKPGKDRYTVKMDVGDGPKADVMVGRQLVVTFKKNKAAQALGRSARFDFYHIETDDYPFGIDVAADVISAGKVSGVIEGTGWYKHPMFPKGKLQGKNAVAEFFAENPEKVWDIREEVLAKMREDQKRIKPVRQLEAV